MGVLIVLTWGRFARFWAMLLALLLAAPAEARVHAGPPATHGQHRLKSVGGVLDGGIVSAPAAAGYSFRKLRAAYAGKAVQLRRASDSAVLDIGFTAGGDFDTPAATTFCAATTCFIAKWYDQSGNARDMVQATLANQPSYVDSCIGTKPCFTVAFGQLVASSTVTPSVLVTLNAVGKNTLYSGVGNACFYINAGANAIQQHGNFDLTFITTGGGTLSNSFAPRLVWHSHVGVFSGGAGAAVSSVDGVEATGTLAAVTTSGTVGVISNSAGNTCQDTEAIWWDNYALTATERASLTINQRAYWGF